MSEGHDRRRTRPGHTPAAAPLAGTAALAVLAVAAAVAPAQAQQPPIEADRPGLLFAPSTVGAIHLQLEMGAPEIAYRSFDGGEDWELTFPILARLGIVDDFELRAGLSPLTADMRDADPGMEDRASVGPDDLELGMKWRFMEGRGPSPTFLFVPTVTLPTGEDGVGRDGAALQAALQASWALAGDFGTSLLVGAGLESEVEDDWTGTGVVAADVHFPLGGELDGYGELGWLPRASGNDDLLVGGGATWRLTPWAQIDAFMDVGLTSESTDVIVGAGFSRRF